MKHVPYKDQAHGSTLSFRTTLGGGASVLKEICNECGLDFSAEKRLGAVHTDTKQHKCCEKLCPSVSPSP